MICRFKILIHFLKVDIKEDHKLEVEEEEIILVLATMVINKGLKILTKSGGKCLASRVRAIQMCSLIGKDNDIVEVKLVITKFSSYALH
ncbi:hypothetical protein M9H77_29775 [Catharanthus roseus]|uniref:Uncharacterized protein n=1 Tax=Catharanthus roseus TaxID=4058 RepID=A0ACB9ZVC8_CATRO|nr:hypothetical protein M9H77_29775 [Catharanthus roseus]